MFFCWLRLSSICLLDDLYVGLVILFVAFKLNYKFLWEFWIFEPIMVLLNFSASILLLQESIPDLLRFNDMVKGLYSLSSLYLRNNLFLFIFDDFFSVFHRYSSYLNILILYVCFPLSNIVCIITSRVDIKKIN